MRHAVAKHAGIVRVTSFLAAVAVTAALPAANQEDSATVSRRPNVVLIMADDLGAECLSCYGCLEYDTPRLDALAGAGVRFTAAHSQPLCTPSRVQIMTGQYNFRNYDEFGYLDPAEMTFGDCFREAGYSTAVAGKWQLSGQSRSYPRKTDPDDWGFDEFCLWQLNNRAPYGDRGPRYWNPYLEKNGKVIRPGRDAYGPDVCAQFLMDFMTRHQDEPFFVYYPMNLTHSPFRPTPASDSDEPHKTRGKRYFEAMVEYMDRIVGRISDHLERLGLREETLFIFTGDNGTRGNIRTRTKAGMKRGGKKRAVPAGTHVPLIVRWPGHIEAGMVDDRLIDFTDILPSLLAAARIEPARQVTLDGVPFLNADGLSEQRRDAIYCWYRPRFGKRLVQYNATFARNATYKLYADGRLFNVAAHPREGKKHRLTPPLSSEAEAARAQLQQVLDRYARQWKSESQ